jgi:N-acetylglutamate synthase-like GNAT family acetyltransferase
MSAKVIDFEPSRSMTDLEPDKILVVEPARYEDVPALVRMLAHNVPHVSSDTVWHVPWTWQHYSIVRCGGRMVAAGSIQPLDGGRAELRGIVVDRAYRGTGVATLLIQHLVEWASQRGLHAVCVTRKPELFRRLGFEETMPSWLDLRRRPTTAVPEASPGVAPARRVTMARAHGGAA